MNARTTPTAVVPPASPRSWCDHPPEERQHLFTSDLRIRDDRLLCGLCGELLFVQPPPTAA